MLSKGAAKKVTIYVNEDTREHFNSLYESILTFLVFVYQSEMPVDSAS